MFDPIQVTITDVSSTDEGIRVACTWQWGEAAPHATVIPIEARPDTADEVRAIVTRWVLADAEFDHLLAPVRDELLREGWTIEFEDDEEPFEATRVEYDIASVLNRAAALQENEED